MIPKYQTHNGKRYRTNEVGGIDIATVEPTEPCPKCGETCHADFVDIGFGPYSQQCGPYHCDACGWTEE